MRECLGRLDSLCESNCAKTVCGPCFPHMAGLDKRCRGARRCVVGSRLDKQWPRWGDKSTTGGIRSHDLIGLSQHVAPRSCWSWRTNLTMRRTDRMVSSRQDNFLLLRGNEGLGSIRPATPQPDGITHRGSGLAQPERRLKRGANREASPDFWTAWLCRHRGAGLLQPHKAFRGGDLPSACQSRALQV